MEGETSNTLTRRKIIIDVDTGHDDAQAIMMALSQTSRVDVVAITCVNGNIDVDQVCRNTLRVLKVCARLDIPVYKGISSSLIDEDLMVKDGKIHHGKDGLGDVPDNDPPDMSLLQSEHAVQTLLRLTNRHPGEISLVAIGPLTNVAMAIKLDPMFGKKLKDVTIMGGNIEGKGNITPSAEFNFFFDPEAAYITLRELGCPIRLVSWETCLSNSLSWEWFEKWKLLDTPKSKFNQAIIANGVHRIRYVTKLPLYRSCDVIAMATVLDESCVLESQPVYCSVELQGRLTRGQMVVDWMGSYGKPMNVSLVKRIDTEKFAHLLEEMVR